MNKDYIKSTCSLTVSLTNILPGDGLNLANPTFLSFIMHKVGKLIFSQLVSYLSSTTLKLILSCVSQPQKLSYQHGYIIDLREVVVVNVP